MLDPHYLQDFKDFEYRDELLPKDKLERDRFFVDLEKRFMEELLQDEKLLPYLEKFRGEKPEQFAKQYAQRKAHVIQAYKYYIQRMNEEEIDERDYQDSARKALEALLHKKLFNMEQLWRANKIKIEGIDVTLDFHRESNEIMDCSILPPVTEFEVDLLKEFLLTSDDRYDDLKECTHTNRYETLRSKDENGDYEYMPEFFMFYDNRMGTGNLLLLPDIRGEKEHAYVQAAHAEERKNKPAEPPRPTPPMDNRPIFNIFSKDVANAGRVFETDKCIQYLLDSYALSYEKESKLPESYQLEAAIETLLKAKRPIYFDSKKIWYEALLTAEYRYENQRTAEHLDHVVAEYRMMRDLGMKSDNDGEMMYDFYRKIVPQLRELVLKGRRAMGEPENFDY